MGLPNRVVTCVVYDCVTALADIQGGVIREICRQLQMSIFTGESRVTYVEGLEDAQREIALLSEALGRLKASASEAAAKKALGVFGKWKGYKQGLNRSSGSTADGGDDKAHNGSRGGGGVMKCKQA